MTNEAAAESAIRNPALVEQDTIRKTHYFLNPADLDYEFRRTGGGGGSLRVRDRVVTRIGLVPTGNMTLREVISAFPSPDYVRVFDVPGGHFCYEAQLFYVSGGIWVRAGLCEGIGSEYEVTALGARISGSMKVGSLIFFEPASDLEMALRRAGYSVEQARLTVVYMERWKGFGYYALGPGDP